MNKQNFNQSGGFPFQTETLAEMQTAYELFNNLGSLAGNFSIIKGCEITGSTVANGVVYIDGELLPFQGGNLGTNVIIVETYTTQEFQDGTDKVVIVKRYATFGIDSISYPWANFKKPKTTIELTNNVENIFENLMQKAEVSVIQNLLDRIIFLETLPVFVNPIKNKGYFTLGDIASGEPVGTSLPVFGHCVNAIIATYIDGGNTYIDVTFQNSMQSINYKVNFFIESLGNINNDNDAGNPVFKILSNNKFKVGLYEAGAVLQAIRIHFEITEL